MAADTRTEIREMLGSVPGSFENLPGTLLDSEWESFKSIELSDQTQTSGSFVMSKATTCGNAIEPYAEPC